MTWLAVANRSWITTRGKERLAVIRHLLLRKSQAALRLPQLHLSKTNTSTKATSTTKCMHSFLHVVGNTSVQPPLRQKAKKTKLFFPPSFIPFPTDLPGMTLRPLQSTYGSSRGSDKLQQLGAHGLTSFPPC